MELPFCPSSTASHFPTHRPWVGVFSDWLYISGRPLPAKPPLSINSLPYWLPTPTSTLGRCYWFLLRIVARSHHPVHAHRLSTATDLHEHHPRSLPSFCLLTWLLYHDRANIANTNHSCRWDNCRHRVKIFRLVPFKANSGRPKTRSLSSSLLLWPPYVLYIVDCCDIQHAYYYYLSVIYNWNSLWVVLPAELIRLS